MLEGRRAKAGLSARQLVINGVKQSVTRLRDNQASTNANAQKLDVLRGLPSLPTKRGNDPKPFPIHNTPFFNYLWDIMLAPISA